MRLRRVSISLITIWTLLVQATAFAWSPQSPVPHAIAFPQTEQMPCHGEDGSSAMPEDGKTCCGDNCTSCSDLCTGSNAALPFQEGGLDQMMVAHFAALQAEPAVFPAFSLNRFRPPIASRS
jgi:hypothetical protein